MVYFTWILDDTDLLVHWTDKLTRCIVTIMMIYNRFQQGYTTVMSMVDVVMLMTSSLNSSRTLGVFGRRIFLDFLAL